MAELTEEDKDLLRRLGLDETDEGREELDEVDPDLRRLLERNPGIDLSDTALASDDVGAVPGVGIGRDVTDEVQAAQDVKDFTNQGFYRELGERPSLDFSTRLTAAVSDMVGNEVPTEAQVARQANMIEQENYDRRAQEQYDSVGQPITETRYASPFESGVPRAEEVEVGRVYERYTTDDDGNVVISERIRLPEPGSSGTGMAFKEGLNRLKETGYTIAGLIPGVDGKQLREENPDYELTGGQSLGADAVSVGLSSMAGAGALRTGVGLIRGIDTTTRVGRLALGTASTIGATIGEFLAARDGTSGIIISPEDVKSWADSTGMEMTDEQAENWSLAVDGLVVNGTLDSVLTMMGTVVRGGARKVDGVRKFVDREYLRRNIEEGKVLEVLGYLDPTGIRDAQPAQALRNVSEFGRIVNDNRTIKLHIAGEDIEVAADTTRAVMASSEAYIRTTRQRLKPTMSPEEWEKYVQQESAGLSSRMIALMQNQQGTPLVRDAASRVTNEVAGAFSQAAEARLPPGVRSVDEAAQDTTESLVRDAQRQSDAATAEIADVDRQMAALTREQAEVVRNNPVMQEFLDEVGGGLSYDERSLQERLNNVITEDIFPEFKAAADGVDAAYAAIPAGTPIDGEALMEQFEEISRGVELSDIPGNPASTTRRLLTALGKKFEPEEIGLDEAGEPIFETPAQVAERVSEQVDFRSLYEMKGRLSQLINEMSDKGPIRERLIALRRHITSSEPGGQVAYQISLGGDAGRLAQEADQLYRDFKYRFANNDRMEGFSDRMGTTRAYEPSTPEGRTPRGTTDMLVEGRQIMDEAVNEPSGALFGDLVRAASSESAIKEPLADLYIAQAARQLRMALDSGDADRISTVRSSFEANRQRLQNVGAGEILQKLDTALAQMEDDTRRMLDDASGLQSQKEALEQQVKDAQYGVVSELISDVPGTGPFQPRADGRAVLENLFTRPDSANWVREIKTKIDELPDPAARQAATQSLEAVALDLIGRRVLGTTPTGLKGATEAFFNVKSSSVSRLGADEATNYAKALSEIFGKDSAETRGVMTALSALSETDIAQKVRVSQSGSDTMPRATADPSIADSVSTSILLTAGYMNPTAALLRRLSASEVKNASEATKDIAREALAAIISDPNVFSAMVYRVEAGDLSTARKLAEKLTSRGTQAATRSARFNIRTEDPEDTEAGSVSLLDRDMMRLFGLQ